MERAHSAGPFLKWSTTHAVYFIFEVLVLLRYNIQSIDRPIKKIANAKIKKYNVKTVND